MGIWIAIFITLVVFGSILWLKPSARDQALTKLRSLALSKGLKVRLLDEKLAQQLVPWIDNYRPFVFYEKNLPASLKPKTYKARVVRLSIDPNAHEIDGLDPIKALLLNGAALDKLPNTAEAIVISKGGVAILWKEDTSLEGGQHVDDIDKFLNDCINHPEIWKMT